MASVSATTETKNGEITIHLNLHLILTMDGGEVKKAIAVQPKIEKIVPDLGDIELIDFGKDF